MIKLSKKWDYGLKAISYLATKKWQLVKISEIAQELSLSENFLRKIVNDFEKSWLIKTIKGRNGGVILDRELKSISLYDIFSSLGEDLSITNCTSGASCKNEESCVTTKTLKSLQKWFNSLLKINTLENLK